MDENKETKVTPPVTDTDKSVEPSQEKKKELSDKDKAAYNLKKNAERLKELGGDPRSILGDEEDQDEVPSWYKKEKANEAKKTAMQMAESISDETTRNEVIQHLNDSIRLSGNPEDDFKKAVALASVGKNKQIIDEISRAIPPKRTATGGSQPPQITEDFKPTEEEVALFKGFKLSPEKLKDKILAARKKAEAKN